MYSNTICTLRIQTSRISDVNTKIKFKIYSKKCNVKFPVCRLTTAHSPNISRSSCALPSANTGIKHLPPRFTISWTRAVKRLSRSSRFSWMWVPYVDSCHESKGNCQTPQYYTELKCYNWRTTRRTVSHFSFTLYSLGSKQSDFICFLKSNSCWQMSIIL
jgi:hypothetical protein